MRTRAIVAAFLVAVLGVSGCDPDSPSEPADPAPSGTPPTTDFTAQVTVTGQSLHITYHLVNRSGADLLVLNRVPAYNDGGAQIDDRNAVYITGEPGSHTVQIAKRAFAMPKTDRMTWNHPNQVTGVTLAPDKTIDEQLTVPLPLRRHHPYGDDIGYGTIKLPDPVNEVVFCVGVISTASLPIQPSPEPDGALTVPHLSSITAVQHLLCSPPTKLKS